MLRKVPSFLTYSRVLLGMVTQGWVFLREFSWLPMAGWQVSYVWLMSLPRVAILRLFCFVKLTFGNVRSRLLWFDAVSGR
jgi:hypothetical protein